MWYYFYTQVINLDKRPPFGPNATVRTRLWPLTQWCLYSYPNSFSNQRKNLLKIAKVTFSLSHYFASVSWQFQWFPPKDRNKLASQISHGCNDECKSHKLINLWVLIQLNGYNGYNLKDPFTDTLTNYNWINNTNPKRQLLSLTETNECCLYFLQYQITYPVSIEYLSWFIGSKFTFFIRLELLMNTNYLSLSFWCLKGQQVNIKGVKSGPNNQNKYKLYLFALATPYLLTETSESGQNENTYAF